MMSGTPIAINPRTGKAFAPGDTVYAGEIIGYTGRTGNAYNVHFPHLHLSVLNSSWQYINPENFVNGKFQWENDSKTRISRRNLIDIKCDEEIQDIEFEF